MSRDRNHCKQHGINNCRSCQQSEVGQQMVANQAMSMINTKKSADEILKKKTIYDLELHETLYVETDRDLATSIMRVPCGWIYRIFDKQHNMMSAVFIPELKAQDHEDS